VAVVISDTSTGEILWVNGAHTTLSGVGSPERIMGHNLFEFLGPEQVAVAIRDVEATARGESPPPVVYHVRRLDGAFSDVQISSTPILFERRTAMASLVVDVTEIAREKRDIALKEKRFRTIVDESPLAIMVVRGEEVVYANESAARVLEAPSPDAVSGGLVSRHIGPASRGAMREAYARIADGGVRSVDVPIELIGPGGASRPATALVSLLAWDGEPAAKVIIRLMRATD